MTKINKERGPWLTAAVSDKGVPLVASFNPFGVRVRPQRSRQETTIVPWERIALIAAQMDAQAAMTRKIHTVKRGTL